MLDRTHRRWLLPFTGLLLALSLATAVLAQDRPELAAVQNGVPVVVDASGAVQPLPAPPGNIRSIIDVAWSPDGERLALVVYDADYNPQLWVTGPDMAEAVALDAGPLESGFGVSFTPDGNILYAAQGIYPPDFSAPPMVEIRQVAPEAGAQSVALGQYTHVVGCGGGSPIPADWQLWRESGFGGSYLTLQWTPLGIVHSTACSGGSASILDPATGEDRSLGPTFDQGDFTANNPINRLAISPDGTRAAGVRFMVQDTGILTSLALIDLATGEVTDVPTAAQPDQLTWNGNDAVIYSVRNLARDVAAALDGKERAVLAEALGFVNPEDMAGVSAYTVDLRQLDLTTGEETALTSLDAYAVGRLFVADDGALIFSTIDNLDAWVQAIVSGELDIAADTTGEQQLALVPISLYRLPAGQLTPEALGTGLEQFELRPIVAAG